MAARSKLKKRKASGTRQQQGVQGVEIGMRLAFALAAAPGPLTLGELGRAAGLPASKVHRYLVSLCRAKIVEQDSRSGRYDLGKGALVLGLEAQRRLDEFRLADEALDDLLATTMLTVGLVIWGDKGATVVRRKEGRHAVTVTTRVGSIMSPITTSAGRMFAAYLPRDVVRPFIDEEFATGAAHPDRKTYEAQLATIRRDGLARRFDQSPPGIDAVCAPVFDRDNQLMMVITIMGAHGAVDLSDQSTAVQSLIGAARGLSERLGWRAGKSA
jgi:DNA-binding IclR family transcriptional regulator